MRARSQQIGSSPFAFIHLAYDWYAVSTFRTPSWYSLAYEMCRRRIPQIPFATPVSLTFVPGTHLRGDFETTSQLTQRRDEYLLLLGERYLPLGAILPRRMSSKEGADDSQQTKGAGIAVGLVLGVAIGTAMDELAMGIAVGLVLGIGIEAGWSRSGR